MLWLAALCACSTALAAGAQSRAHEAPGPWCGGVRWRLMTLSDPDRMRVDLDSVRTTVAKVAARKAPQTIGIRRTTGFQLASWRMRAVVDRYRIASNGEIVLVLFDIPSGKYMDAYLPSPRCLGRRARDRAGMVAARRVFTAHCPRPSWRWLLLGATVDISGVGFWNPVTTTRGALRNGAELRPVTSLSIVSGCGVGTS